MQISHADCHDWAEHMIERNCLAPIVCNNNLTIYTKSTNFVHVAFKLFFDWIFINKTSFSGTASRHFIGGKCWRYASGSCLIVRYTISMISHQLPCLYCSISASYHEYGNKFIQKSLLVKFRINFQNSLPLLSVVHDFWLLRFGKSTNLLARFM